MMEWGKRKRQGERPPEQPRQLLVPGLEQAEFARLERAARAAALGENERVAGSADAQLVADDHLQPPALALVQVLAHLAGAAVVVLEVELVTGLERHAAALLALDSYPVEADRASKARKVDFQCHPIPCQNHQECF